MTFPAISTTPQLGAALLKHLDDQLRSADRMLDLVLRQARAVRVRDIEVVLSLVGQIQAESDARARLEADRTTLLTQAGSLLGVHGSAITIDAFCSLLDPASAFEARERSERLRGVLREVRDEHLVTRALMRQELAFVDHLVRLMGAGDDPNNGTYAPPTGPRSNAAPARQPHRLLDLQA
ncbi:MAG: flagellar export chaperone FlgN [Solirubrobacteraceae bacterium]|nr:flagellar export chaperone FlgN [Solirubrobacteraceae bacterium]